MSKSGGGGGRGSGGGGGAARITIPESVRETIQSIREITGKQHSDEDIFSALQDCSMDPNDTAQKLLYLDTFHEVKRKRDRKKEILGTISRGSRSGRGNYSAKHAYADAVPGRNSILLRENGVHHMTERGSSMSLPVKEKMKSDAAVPEAKASTVMPNGPSSLSNGSSSGCGPQSPAGGDVSSTHGKSDDDVWKLSTLSLLPAVPSSVPNQKSQSVIQVQQGNPTSSTIPASVSGVYSSATDLVLPPSMTWNPGAVGAIKHELRCQQSAVEHDHMEGNKHASFNVETALPKNEKEASTVLPAVNEKMAPGVSKAVKINELSQTEQPSLPIHNSSLAAGPATVPDASHSSQESDVPLKVASLEDVRGEESATLLKEQTISNGHVTFPDHLKVPEALKSGLTFGSFDSNSGIGTKCSNINGWEINSAHAAESLQRAGESANETSSSDQSLSSPVVDHPEQPESPQVFDKAPKPEANIALYTDSKSDKQAQEIMLFSEGHQNSTFPIVPNYGFGIMPPLQAGHFVQFEGQETQARDVSRNGFVNENPTTSSSPSPTPPPPVQNPIAASPQPVLFRPPYPPNYYPYGHYFNPYFMPPMHQFLTHNGLPQQPATGNAYLGQAAAGPGVKFPVPQFKQGTSTGNPTPTGIQSLYGTYGSSPVGFNPGPAVTSGNSASNEDLSASQLKESQIYTTGPLSDVSAWISPSGQDVSSLHLNSLYLTPQGQHLTFSPAQTGHGPFPGIYAPVQSLQTIAAAPSTVNPLLQQSQSVSAALETVGHLAGAYQQTQLAQVNWNASY